MDPGIRADMIRDGAAIVDVARLTETFGFESLWMGEHITIPTQVADAKRHAVNEVSPEYRNMAGPFIWLAAVAVAATHLRLSFNICLVPQ